MKYEEELTEDEKEFINEPLVKKITRTVAEGKTVLAVQTVEFRRQAEVDPDTLDTTYGKWEPENGIWEKYEIPVRKGYRPSIGMVEPETVTPDAENVTVSVSYRPVKKSNRQRRKRKNFTQEELAELAEMGKNIPVKKNTNIQSDEPVIKAEIEHSDSSESRESRRKINSLFNSKNNEDDLFKKMDEKVNAVLSKNKHSAEDSSLNENDIGTENSENADSEKGESKTTVENSKNTIFEKVKPEMPVEKAETAIFEKVKPVKTSENLSTGVRHAAADKYQKKLFKDKMKRHMSIKRRRPVDIADTSNFSDETLKLLDEFKVIGEETLLRGKWKVNLFAE